MAASVFGREARQRLRDLHPSDWGKRFSQLLAFSEIARDHLGVPFIPPPEIDTTLHDVMGARDTSGKPLERLPVSHLMNAVGHEAIGKTYDQLTGPLVMKSRAILAENGFSWDPTTLYSQPACSFTVLTT